MKSKKKIVFFSPVLPGELIKNLSSNWKTRWRITARIYTVRKASRTMYKYRNIIVQKERVIRIKFPLPKTLNIVVHRRKVLSYAPGRTLYTYIYIDTTYTVYIVYICIHCTTRAILYTLSSWLINKHKTISSRQKFRFH